MNVAKIGSGHLSHDAAAHVYKTDRYDIHVAKDEVKIFDRETNKWIRVWGDPHVETSDGDKAGFQKGNLTFDLDDGTKITVVPTKVDANGVAFVDKVAITNGSKGVEITGVHSDQGPQEGEVSKYGADIDKRYDDQNVLHVGGELDDLFFYDKNGARTEISGTYAGERFGEFSADDIGGLSNNLSVIAGDTAKKAQLHEIEAKIERLEKRLKDPTLGDAERADVEKELSDLVTRKYDVAMDARDIKHVSGGKNSEIFNLMYDNESKIDELKQKLRDPNLSDVEKQAALQEMGELRQMNQLLMQQMSEEQRSQYEMMKTIIQNSRA